MRRCSAMGTSMRWLRHRVIMAASLLPLTGCAAGATGRPETAQPAPGDPDAYIAGYGERHGRCDALTPEIIPDGTGGALTMQAIQHEVAKTFPAVDRCYDEMLLAVPVFSGRVEVKFRIERDGSVRQVALHSTELYDGPDGPGAHGERALSAVGCCIAHLMFERQFASPQGDGTIDVTYPFVLVPPAQE